jgi:hypothetical protein
MALLYVTILNEQYLVQGAGTAGLVTGRAGAGGLSSTDRIVEGRLTGTEEKGNYIALGF